MKKVISILLCIMIIFCTLATASCTNKDNSKTTAEQTTAELSTTPSGTNSNKADFSKTAKEFVAGIKVGWNLGNTMEACYSWTSTPLINPTPAQAETAWNNPATTQAMIDTVADAGFNAIRIPVSWYLFVKQTNVTYTIDEAWLARIKEIVNYAYNDNMYVIIDMHHDDGDWLSISKTGKDWEAVKSEYKALWKIIATYFKDYNEKLILEGANEIIYKTADNSDWWGQDTSYFTKLNDLYKIFVDTVRATGGNNGKRYLMLPTYGAQWYTHQYINLVIPNNDDHIIVDIHWYTEDTSDAENYFVDMYTNLIVNGIPVILGECGVVKATSDENKATWAKGFIKTAKAYGIKCFLWDDGGDFQILIRDELTWNSPKYVQAVIQNAN